MARYIDADKLIAYIKEVPKTDRFAKYWIGETETWVPFLKNFPSADVRENVRGKWILQDNPDKQLYHWHYCSNCGAIVGTSLPNFCSECGADMREVQDE